MEELGRLLPLLIIWALYWLISRRGEKHHEQPPAPRKDEGAWLPPEALELPPLEYEAPERAVRKRVYYQDLPAKESRAPAPMQAPHLRRVRTGGGCRGGISRRKLRHVFVWSEILAPPVGMREK